MGEVAEMMLDGTLCSCCGVFLNEQPLGYPVECSECDGSMNTEEDHGPTN